ncbi:ligase-associated DNA damage response endonuclease PdeM [Falsirhodobacter halotolerans]|uniref:ligase-associated DNA damage response endonuclease PdeM n=1 Tax=Falsirhodobacter halotolerans TaxID=1146892 RepID=UPI001FD49DCC|nr:ligase-associated DNA damage response endonuclease PdeM [Falsirhodobacter halotolerans]MCJ8138665.1 ligase-associated DNA damage response endonuclease PdeM [Falsirhodobacter halotolerans]
MATSCTSSSTADHSFRLAGETLRALPSGALFWPAEGMLIVADLHFGKSERLARRGGALLPPYEVRDTLSRLDADIAATAARSVICVGDSFDDAYAMLEEAERLWLARLMAGRDWVWVAGNHDPVPMAVGGTYMAETTRGPLTFRHIATGDGVEISGHYHPKARLAGQARPCFLTDARQVILPAYGTYTGGLWCDDPVLEALMGDGACAILTGTRALAVPFRASAPPAPPARSRGSRR